MLVVCWWPRLLFRSLTAQSRCCQGHLVLPKTADQFWCHACQAAAVVVPLAPAGVAKAVPPYLTGLLPLLLPLQLALHLVVAPGSEAAPPAAQEALPAAVPALLLAEPAAPAVLPLPLRWGAHRVGSLSCPCPLPAVLRWTPRQVSWQDWGSTQPLQRLLRLQLRQ